MFWFIHLAEQRKNYDQFEKIVKNTKIVDKEFKNDFKNASVFFQQKIRKVLNQSKVDWIEVKLEWGNQKKGR